ncbi:MAG TPA: phosphatidylserine decarboxylase family protein [Pyrinomonadaceae bacterium]
MGIVRDSIPYIVVPVLLALLFLAFGLWYVTVFFLLIAAFMAYFFRDPKRIPPNDPNVVVAPADGRVTQIKSLAADMGSSTLVSIFLSPLDVHINRSPIAGLVSDISYSHGKFLMATNQKASLMNEQNELVIEGEKVTVVCKQIAGILARRIVCWTHKGDKLELGERFGMIKFSSRTDVILPQNVSVTISEGKRVQGGVTVIGRIS